MVLGLARQALDRKPENLKKPFILANKINGFSIFHVLIRS
jgi:hypothetical protein